MLLTVKSSKTTTLSIMKPTVDQKTMSELADNAVRQKQTNLTLLPIQIAYILILIANILLVGGTLALILYRYVLIFVISYIVAWILLCVAIYLMLKGIKLVKQVLNITSTGLINV